MLAVVRVDRAFIEKVLGDEEGEVRALSVVAKFPAVPDSLSRESLAPYADVIHVAIERQTRPARAPGDAS